MALGGPSGADWHHAHRVEKAAPDDPIRDSLRSGLPAYTLPSRSRVTDSLELVDRFARTGESLGAQLGFEDIDFDKLADIGSPVQEITRILRCAGLSAATTAARRCRAWGSMPDPGCGDRSPPQRLP